MKTLALLVASILASALACKRRWRNRAKPGIERW